MGELATASEDLPRYQKDGFTVVTPALTGKLEAVAKDLEAKLPKPTDWSIPGANPNAAALDLARTICRRAERSVSALKQSNQLPNPEILVFLNRLADLLWLLARFAEAPAHNSGAEAQTHRPTA
jgi:cob(I)alamin adenosyltransferase